jgi:tetratricopeptide (TPR) repeat protein
MKKKIIVSVVVLTVLLTLSVTAIVFLMGEKAAEPAKAPKEILSAEEYFARGMKHVGNEDYRRAFSVLKSAVKLEPNNSKYHWELAKLAKVFNKKTLVRRHAESAWKNGLNNTRVFFFILDTHEGTGSYIYRKGLALLGRVDNERLKKELLGDLQIRTGDSRKGIETLESAYEENGEGLIALKLVRILLLNGEKEKALAFLGDLRSEGGLDSGLFNLYVTAVIFNDDYKTADDLFDEYMEKEWFDDSLKLKRSVFKMAKGEFGTAREILEEMNGRFVADAEKSTYNPIGMTVRKYLSFLYSLENNREKVGELYRQSLEEGERFGGSAGEEPTSSRKADNRLLEGEQLLYSYLRESERERSYDLIKSCRLLLPSEPVSNFYFIRHCMFNGRFEEGEELFRNIRNDDPGESLAGVEGIFYRNPVFLVNVAEAFVANRRTDTALYLLSWVHERGIYSKQSIRLFRDLTYSKQRSGLSREAQKMLEDVCGDDETVAFQGAVLEMNAGNLDNSLRSLNSLLERRPESEPVKIARVTVLMRQGKYDEALKECDALKAPAENICTLRARIYAAMNETAKAEECFKKSIAINGKPVAKLEYANFLLSRGKENGAFEIYHSILNEKPEEPSALLGLAAIHINGGDPAGARECLDRVMVVNDKIEYLYILLAKTDLLESKPDEAVLKCRMALAINPDVIL